MSEAKAKKAIGVEAAEKLKHRLSDLRAASYVTELVSGNPRELGVKGVQYYVLDLCDDIYILFSANHNNNPMHNGSVINWSKVSRIKISNIGQINVL